MSRRKPFYGWAIAAMGTLGHALQGGLIFWSMGIYLAAFEEHFAAPRAKLALAESFLTLGVNVMSPFVGYLVDKQSARHIVTIGTLSLGLGLIVLSFAGTLLSVWAAFLTFIPFGALTIGTLPSSTLISRWFRKRRGLALGISVSGTSIGGALAPPLLTWLFMSYGWRAGLLYCGIAVVLFAPVFFFVLANYPEDKGLEQEEEALDSAERLTEIDAHDWGILEILRTSAFWLQTVITGIMVAVTLALMANLGLHARDLGFAGQQTALMYSTFALCSFVAKVAFGRLIDSIGVRRAGLISVALMILGLAQLVAATSWPLVLTSVVFIGLAAGGNLPIWTNLIARSFGARSFGRAMGIMNPLQIPITFPAAPLAGHISDTTGSYAPVFVAFIFAVAIVGVCFVLLRKPVPRAASPG